MAGQASEESQAFLERHVALFNAAVCSGDFSQFVDNFTEDAILEYDGIPDPPYVGRQAIAQRYRDDPPDDPVSVVRWKTKNGCIIAEFRWRDIPEAIGGCVVIERRGDKVSHLTVAVGHQGTLCWK